jgi:hypothetical protein
MLRERVSLPRHVANMGCSIDTKKVCSSFTITFPSRESGSGFRALTVMLWLSKPFRARRVFPYPTYPKSLMLL